MSERKKILIIDDVAINRQILREIFHEDYDILEAENGEKGLMKLARNLDSIAIVLLDFLMPVMNGLDFLIKMQDYGWLGRVPVILITVEDSQDKLLQSYELGVADVIPKPFKFRIVQQRVENVIRLHQYKNNLERLVAEQRKALEKKTRELERFHEFLIDTLSTVVEFRSMESGQHVRRIRVITKALAEKMVVDYPQYGIHEDQVEMIARASVLHDIGKIAVPDAILQKPGRLTKEEFEIMKTHTISGCEMMKKIKGFEDEAFFEYGYEICRYHHERWDGRGYPEGLKGNKIPIWAQLVSIADVYDALVSPRVYKAAFSHEKAVEMIKNGECGQFNPDVMECFLLIQDIIHGFYEYETA